MAIDLSGIPDAAPVPKIDLSSIPDAPKKSGVDLSGIPDANSSPFAGLAAFENASGMLPNADAILNPATKTFTGKTNQDRAIEDFSKPSPTAPFDKNLAGAGIGSNLAIAGDFASSPSNFIPLPIAEGLGAVAKPLGAFLERFAPQVAKGLANEVRSFNPSWNARLNTPPVDQNNIVNAINTHDVTPVTPPAPDQSAQIPETQPDGQMMFRGFPEAPAATPQPQNTPDYLAAIAKYEDSLRNRGQQQFDFTQGPQEPVAPVESAPVPEVPPTPAAPEAPPMRVLPNKQMILSDVINRKTLKPTPETPVGSVPEEPVQPFPESPDQQQFDFTQGPQEPPGEPQQSLQELRRALKQKLLDLNSTDAEIAQIQQQIRDQAVPDHSSAVVEPVAPPSPVNPRVAAKQKLSLSALKKAVSEYRTISSKDSLSAVDELRLEELGKNIANLKKSVSPEQLAELKTVKSANEPAPNALEDAATILLGLNKKGSTGGGRYTPEAQAAIERFRTKHGPDMAEYLKTTGNTVEGFVASKLPSLNSTEAKFIADALVAPQKIGSFNLKQYPEEQKQQLRDLFAGQEEKLKTKPMTREQILEKSKELTSLPVTEAISRNEAGQTAAELTRRTTNDIAKLKAIAEDPNLSTQETIQRILQSGTEKTKKVKTEIGRALGSMNVPLEAQEEQLTAMRKIVDRLRADPKLTSVESKDLIRRIKGQFPDLKSVTTADVVKEVFRNFITSSPVTWGVNAISNYGNLLSRPAMRTLEVSSAKIRSLLSGQPTTATYKEIGAMLKGMADAVGGKKLPDALKSKTFSDKYSVGAIDTLAAGAKTKAGQEALGVTAKVVNAPSNIMRHADDHAKNIMGMMEMYASKARGEDVLNDQNAILRITSAQARGSFQDEMSGIGKWIAQARNYYSHQPPTALNQAGDILTYVLQPFIQTVDRIIAGGINNSILGTVSTGIKAATGKYAGALAKGIENDPIAGEKLDRDMAAAMIGIPLFIWTGMQLANGNLSGAAPQDTAGREAFQASGKSDYDLKMGTRRVPIRLLPEPMATAMQINTALIQGLQEARDKEQSVSSGVFNAITKIGYMLGTKQYLGGMNSLVNAVAGKDSSGDVVDPNDVTNSANRNPIIKKILPSVLVPSIVKDVGVVKDTLENKPRVMADTAVETVKRRAGMTKGMVPELNTFGEPVTHQSIGRVENDPAYTLVAKFPPQPVNRMVDGVRLSQQEYHDLKKSVGEQRKLVYQTLANNPQFMKSPDGVQQMIVKDMVSTADQIGSVPEKVRELQSDPMYYDSELRTILQIKKPGGERHFPYVK